MENKLNIAKRTDPIDSMDYHTWLKTFNVSSGYVQPTPYFMHNEFNSKVFKGEPTSFLEWIAIKIFKQ